jgi:hypothetical protein
VTTATPTPLRNSKFEIRNSKLEGFCVEWDPRLIEEAVLLAVQGRRVQGFRGERNRLYAIQGPEERDTAFREFHAVWFERLELGGVIWQAVQEQPLILAHTCVCVVAQARASRDEGAELFVSPSGEGLSAPERRWVVLRIEPKRLLDREGLLAFLRHEFFHIADMLDPIFGYEPQLPRSDAGPARERLLQDRYRVLWDTTIDGRLWRRGWVLAAVRERRLREFARTFPILGERMEAAFERFFHGNSCTHSDLVAFASNPATEISNFKFQISNLPTSSRSSNPKSGHPLGGRNPQSGERCALCGFPTHAFEPAPDLLPPTLLDLIRADFPTWDPARGLCRQCADLYRSRSPVTAPSS